MGLLKCIACLLISTVLASPVFAATIEISGEGYSMSSQVLRKWGKRYQTQTGIPVAYDSLSQGTGLMLITRDSVDFALSDVPFTKAEQVESGLAQFPLLATAIVPVINLPMAGGQLKLNASVLSGIFWGRITNWNAPQIALLNPDLALPDLPIKLIVRADGCGSSFYLTRYLSENDPTWQQKIGIGSRVAWPTGTKAQGREKLMEAVQSQVGAIGYAEHVYAKQFKVQMANLVNAQGKPLTPGTTSVENWILLTDSKKNGYYLKGKSPQEGSWPIVGVTYLLLNANDKIPARQNAVIDFVGWVLENGKEEAEQENFAFLPALGLKPELGEQLKELRQLLPH